MFRLLLSQQQGALLLQEVATFTASCEKYVGTESGGMDQAISIMGAPGIAKLVEFNPVRPLLSLSCSGHCHCQLALSEIPVYRLECFYVQCSARGMSNPAIQTGCEWV